MCAHLAVPRACTPPGMPRQQEGRIRQDGWAWRRPDADPSRHAPCPGRPSLAVTRDAATLAEQLGVRIFTADIIYHLFDQFTAYLKQVGGQGRQRCPSTAALQIPQCSHARGGCARPPPPLRIKPLLHRAVRRQAAAWRPPNRGNWGPSPPPHRSPLCLPPCCPAGQGGGAGGGQADGRLPLRAQDHPHMHLQPKGAPGVLFRPGRPACRLFVHQPGHQQEGRAMLQGVARTSCLPPQWRAPASPPSCTHWCCNLPPHATSLHPTPPRRRIPSSWVWRWWRVLPRSAPPSACPPG